VTTSTPIASPDHHAVQTGQNPLRGSPSSSTSTSLPTIALMDHARRHAEEDQHDYDAQPVRFSLIQLHLTTRP
jgi:hypothetical protein